MDISNQNKYIDFNDFEGRWYFEDKDAFVSANDKNEIKPLASKYSSKLWEQCISVYNNHFMLIDSKEKFTASLEKQSYNWKADWNNGTYETFANYLISLISYNENDTIITFWNKELAVETRWRIFIRNWISFLFDDEGLVVINPRNEEVLVFCINGVLLKGKR